MMPKRSKRCMRFGRPRPKGRPIEPLTSFCRLMKPSTRKPRCVWRKIAKHSSPYYAFPAAHWQSLRTTNPIESTFGTIRHRTKRTKSCLTRAGMLHMMFKLGRCAEKTWRRLRGFRHLVQVSKGIQFRDGREVTTTEPVAA